MSESAEGDGEKIVIGPSSFISGPYEQCPACGAEESYGLLSVHRHSYAKRCKECLETQTTDLPVLDKQMIYLDQHAISHLSKSLHPDSKHKYEQDKPATHFGFWGKVFAKLDRLHKLQLAVCPISPVQRSESLLDSRLTERLKTVGQHLAGEVSFRDSDSIRMMQLSEALDSFLTGDSVELDRNQVVNGNLDCWLDKLRISVDMGLAEVEREEARAERERHAQGLKAHRKETLASSRQGFDGYFRDILDSSRALLDGMMARSVVFRSLEKNGVPDRKWSGTIDDFSHSDQMHRMPQLQLWAGLFAAYNVEVIEKRASEVKPSLYYDFVGISSYLPYSDAFFVDRECARLLEVAREHGAVPWATRVFTIDLKDEFLAYLEEIEASAPSGHLELVERVYGPDWLRPFWEIHTWRK